MGGIIGRAALADCTVKDCANYGNITAAGDTAHIGGIVGYFIHSSSTGSFLFDNLYNKGTVSSDTTYTGGIIGHTKISTSNCGSIKNCLNAGDVVTSSAKTTFGGVIGVESASGVYTVENIYVSGSVGTKDIIIGTLKGGNYTNCYYLDIGENCTNNAGATAVTEDNFAIAETFAGFTSEYWLFTKYGPELKTFHVHTEEILEAVEPTYTSTGLTEGKKCSVCDEILEAQQEIPKLVHENDLDGDGMLSLADAMMLIRSVVDGSSINGGDINGDGEVNLLDVIGILKKIIA